VSRNLKRVPRKKYNHAYERDPKARKDASNAMDVPVVSAE